MWVGRNVGWPLPYPSQIVTGNTIDQRDIVATFLLLPCNKLQGLNQKNKHEKKIIHKKK